MMKKLRMLMPVLAILLAVTGVFATEKQQASALDVVVSIGDGTCNIDGKCDQSNSSACVFLGITFKIRQGITFCLIIATGNFKQ